MIGHRPLTRNTLVTALTAFAETSMRARARRFLTGLSADELQFIAEFLGSCILESPANPAGAAEAVQWHHYRIAAAGPLRRDREIKLILLREYLRRTVAA